MRPEPTTPNPGLPEKAPNKSRRWSLIAVTALAVGGIIGTAILGLWVDREQCKGTARAIHNSRTMWEWAIERNPGPEADIALDELNRRIPAAHCVGGRLILDAEDEEP